ncbi:MULTISPECIES: DUF1015 domain-containing protein [Actinomycetaceae]|uniref:DUF1015 domain-containing protein n=1 Tax=Actinomycetaceae TaxID=2049 RepID=UPI0027820A1E|nr:MULTISPECIES: DUF1015 domain-containing protein [Actinomycetaceae]MDP9834171.1 hypothetical protein [Gleimia europaea]MDU6679827.1 DUF1015 domain-containing protein [Actinomyces sp.]
MTTAQVFPANIGLPKDADLYKWCVIAADQFSASPEYWREVEQIVGNAPSTLRMIVPEVYLAIENEEELQARVKAAHVAMREYLDSHIEVVENAVIYTERATPYVKKRRSLVLALDLETYSYTGQEVDARASEATVLERIPAREAVRRGAALELPHVQVLYDDPDFEVQKLIDPTTLSPLYSTDLMKEGGSVKGWHIPGDSQLWASIKNVLDGLEARHGFRFIVGDGNHSLAAAKSHWEHLKLTLSASELANHPARFALVELINVHDDGLVMEPIHRLLRGISSQQLQDAADKWNENHDGEVVALDLLTASGRDTLKLVQPGALVVEPVQELIDQLISDLGLDPAHACEYIHGEDELARLVNEENALGIDLPALDRSSLFEYVAKQGAMPRKSFSLGEANEKRYYLETRQIS